MPIRSLKLSNFRNLECLELELSTSTNFIIGNNGSGKTSVLEAIYLLSTGRSFRTTNLAKLVRFDSKSLLINAAVSTSEGGEGESGLISLVDYYRDNSNSERKLLLNNCPAKSVAEIAALLPVCIMDSASFHGLSSSPAFRRQLFDWGMFHVKPQFLNTWRKYNHILAQRNALLRQIKQDSRLTYQQHSWDELFIAEAYELINLRYEHFQLLKAAFNDYIKQFLPKFAYSIKLEINHGVGYGVKSVNSIDKSYINQCLTDRFGLDINRGYTSTGPHRADIVFKYNDLIAKDLVSRGQEKLIIVAFYLAQLKVIKQETEKKCTVLFDDLAAELDKDSLALLYQQLLTTEHQLVFTAIRENDMPVLNKQDKLFHVEQLTNKPIKTEI